MARPVTSARRYAEAAFEIALRDGQLDPWRKDLDTAASILADERGARVVEDPAMLGGLTIRVGDRLLDDSVRGRLERLRDQLRSGARPR
jgi:F0F1-type ATP synthase delta subunit